MIFTGYWQSHLKQWFLNGRVGSIRTWHQIKERSLSSGRREGTVVKSSGCPSIGTGSIPNNHKSAHSCNSSAWRSDMWPRHKYRQRINVYNLKRYRSLKESRRSYSRQVKQMLDTRWAPTYIHASVKHTFAKPSHEEKQKTLKVKVDSPKMLSVICPVTLTLFLV